MSVYALNLLRELVSDGHDVTMISQFRGDERGMRVYGGGAPPCVEGVRVIGLEAHGEQAGGDFERDIDAMREAIMGEHARAPFDIIHAQYAYPTGLAAMLASCETNVPNLVSIQGGDGHWIGSCCATHEHQMQVVLNHAGALLIGSRSFAAEVEGNHNIPLERFTIVPGAIDTKRFHLRADAKLGALRDPPTLLYHGRIDRRKGALDLIEAFSLIASREPQRKLRLIVSGIGPDSDAVRALVKTRGLDSRVEILGYVDYASAHEIYACGDIFVSPTYAEGFSNTILEAMASGLPVISTRAVGVVDCLRDDGEEDDNSLLVMPGDVEALAASIVRLLDDEDLRQRLARQAIEEVERLYSWRTVGGQIVNVYQAMQGTAPDCDWKHETKIMPCRFRLEPHLL